MVASPHIRPARPDDDVVELLYLSAAAYYDAYAGSRRRALAILRALWRRDSHNASWEICRVAERDGELVGAAAGFPIEHGERLAGRFVHLSVPRIPPWRWPLVAIHLRAASRMAPVHPVRSWYIDALAVAEGARRQGVAHALLDDAVQQAVARRCGGIALDTGIENAPARALYEGWGFERGPTRRAPSKRIERAVGGAGFVSYYRPTLRR